MKKNLLILLALLCTITSYSQINWYALAGPTTIVEDLVVCSDTTYRIYIFNAGTDTIKSNVVDINLPPSISYIPGSFLETTVVTASNPLRNVAESNISNLNQPFFSFDDIPPNGYVSFDYRVHATCGLASNSVPIPIILNYIDGGTNAPATSSPNSGGTPLNPVNINKASINLVAVTNDNYTGSVGQSYSQTLTLRNAGLGFVDGTSASSAFLYVLLDETNCLSISNPSIGTLSNDTLWIPLSEFQNIGDLDEYWDNNEDILITYDVTIECCNDLTRNVTAQWGCDKSVCETTNAFPSNVVIPNLVPDIAYANITNDYDFCFDGSDKVTQRIRIINTGTGPASNFCVKVRRNIPGSYASQSYFDTTGGWDILDAAQNVIGNSSNFSGIITGNFFDGSCVSTARPMYLTVCLDSLILQAGDTIFLDVTQGTQNYSCTDYCGVGVGWAAIQAEINYSNQCGTTNYTEPFKTLLSRAYAYANFQAEMPTDLSDQEEFKICLSYGSLNNIADPDGNGTHYIVVPLTGTDLVPNGTSVTHTQAAYSGWPMNVVNDTLYIGPLPDNTNSMTGEVCIPMKAVCGTGGSHTVQFWNEVYYDSLCGPTANVKLGCKSKNYVLHCPAPCPRGGATPVKFSLTRTTRGLPDNDENHVPDPNGVLDTTLISLHHAVNGDTLNAHWEINVYGNSEPTDPNVGVDHTYTYVEFDLGTSGYPTNDANGNPYPTTDLTAIPNANVIIYPSGGGAAINCTVSPTISGTIAKYDLNACRSPWEAGDSIVMDAQFIANGKLFSSGVNNYTTDNEVYSSYIPNPTGALSGPDKYTCDSYNDYMDIYHIWISPWVPGAQAINGCNNNLTASLRQYTRFQEAPIMFPYEYRNFAYYDEFKVVIPEEFDYRSNTAKFNGISIPNSDVSRIGDTLYFKNLGQYYTVNGGTILPGDEREARTLTYQVSPNCDAIAGNVIGGVAATVIGNGINTYPSTLSHASDDGGVPGNFSEFYGPTNRYVYNAPQQFVTGGGTIAVTGEDACWNLVLNNGSNSVDAPNSWIYLEALEGLPLDSVEVSYGVTTAPENNGFYLLGNTLSSSSKVLEICGKLQDCDTVKILVHSGWDCDAYPIFFDSTLCYETDTLIVYSFPAGTDATFNVLATGPNGTVNFCDTFEVELIMNANQLGDLNSLTNDFILPFGFEADLSNISIAYPAGTAYRPPSNPSAVAVNGSIVNVDIDAIDSTLSNGILGSYDIPGKEVRIKIPLYSECGAVSGDVVKVAYNANAACSEALPEIFKESAPIIFAQATVPGYITNPNGTMDTVKGCDPATVYTYTVNIPISSTGANSSALDSILVSLPPGVIYSGYDPIAAGQTNQPTVAPNGPVDLGTGALRYSWPMTGGLTTGDFIQYDIEVTFDYSEFISCNANLNNFEISTGGNTAVVCNGVNCTVTSINGRGSSGLTIALPEIEASVTASPDCIADPANNAYTLTTDIEVCNNSSVANVPAGTTITVYIYCDVNANTTLDATDTYISSITTTGAIPANGCLTIPSNSISYTCPGGALLAVINRLPENSGPEQCLCAPESATDWTCNVAGFLPVDILKFVGHPLENGDNLLNWTVTDEKYVSHYDVERSEDGGAFEKIGEVLATNETQDHMYDFADDNPYPVSWYRLRSQDIDGQYAYSKTISIRRTDINSNTVLVYPNPASKEIKFVYQTKEDDANIRISLMDMAGRVLNKRTELFSQDSPMHTIDISGLSNGNYIIQYTNTDTKASGFVKFTKE